MCLPCIHPLDLQESLFIGVHLVRIKLVDDEELAELLDPGECDKSLATLLERLCVNIGCGGFVDCCSLHLVDGDCMSKDDGELNEIGFSSRVSGQAEGDLDLFHLGRSRESLLQLRIFPSGQLARILLVELYHERRDPALLVLQTKKTRKSF